MPVFSGQNYLVASDVLRERMNDFRMATSIQVIQQRKVRLFGHVARVDGNLAKTILWGKMEEKGLDEDQTYNG